MAEAVVNENKNYCVTRARFSENWIIIEAVVFSVHVGSSNLQCYVHTFCYHYGYWVIVTWTIIIIITVLHCLFYQYSRSFTNGQWYCFNDQSVSRVSLVTKYSNMSSTCTFLLLCVFFTNSGRLDNLQSLIIHKCALDKFKHLLLCGENF